HPTKLEVRFSKERELFNAIEEMIKEKFRETTLIPEIQQKVVQREKSVQPSLDFRDLSDQKQFMEQISNQQVVHEKTVPSPDFVEPNIEHESMKAEEPVEMPMSNHK